MQIRVVIIGRRAVDCAARNSRAQGAPRFLVPLRPRCARLTALTARAATRVLATIDGLHGSA